LAAFSLLIGERVRLTPFLDQLSMIFASLWWNVKDMRDREGEGNGKSFEKEMRKKKIKSK